MSSTTHASRTELGKEKVPDKETISGPGWCLQIPTIDCLDSSLLLSLNLWHRYPSQWRIIHPNCPISVAAEHMQYHPCRCDYFTYAWGTWLSCPVSNLLTVFLNSVMDRRRPQELTMLTQVSEYLFPSCDSFCHPWQVCDCANQPAQSQVRESWTVAWCNIVDNPASPNIANARMHCWELGHLSPHLSSSCCHREITQHSHFHSWPNGTSFGFGPSASSSQLHHLPPTLPLTHLNSQLLPWCPTETTCIA